MRSWAAHEILDDGYIKDGHNFLNVKSRNLEFPLRSSPLLVRSPESLEHLVFEVSFDFDRSFRRSCRTYVEVETVSNLVRELSLVVTGDVEDCDSRQSSLEHVTGFCPNADRVLGTVRACRGF